MIFIKLTLFDKQNRVKKKSVEIQSIHDEF